MGGSTQIKEKYARVMVVSMAVVSFRGFRGLRHLFALHPGICSREAGRQKKVQELVLGEQVGWGVS
jgi:hypothetical protein